MRMYGPSAGDRLPPPETIDLYAPETFRSASQHPAWAALRTEAPVWRQETPDGTPFWSVTRYKDVVELLRNTDDFSSETGTLLSVIHGDDAGGKTILLTDPPVHTYIKAPVAKLMSTRMTFDHTDRIAANVRRLVQPCLEGGTHDFARLMNVLPMAAAGEVLGVPEEYWSDVATWTMTGLAPEDPAFATGTPKQTLQMAHHQLFSLFSELVADRRRNPGDDLISVLLQLDFGGRPMTTDEVLLNCYTFAMGTNSTTPHVACQMMLAMLEHPEAWDALQKDPGLIITAVEEVARWATPTNHLMRRTTREVEMAGSVIPEGAPVCAWLASANRDETVFRDPYEFDPARKPNPHIAFGIGTHYCTGARAARMVLRILLEELVTRFDRFEPDGEPEHLYSNFVNGMSSLPVTAYPKSRQPSAPLTGGDAVSGVCPVGA
ncbi:cytochrome P450 [Streptomyces albidus (ex Kaewkla and Franco 2022)]|uniref:cytochrome P450 n=1 Tax=Streptomyces albidus (ex Kaewkla and Franco 2022) TaxID=722709 RepID=UPI0015EE7517|nr:cytochrome P450 [Streptomyces albidus (ex Kaewkla and Franco 2022)]